MASVAKFVVYNTQAGYDGLLEKAQDTFYFVRETLRIYRAEELYSDVIQVDSLPTTNIIPYKIYVVSDENAYLSTLNDWIHLNANTSGGGEIEIEGITLNGKTIGGIKYVIEESDSLIIPENWQYNVRGSLTLNGKVYTNGILNIE